MSGSASPSLSVPARQPAFAAPFAALVVGATAMGISPIFVRVADVGPFASAFWRVCLALPILFLWARFEAARAARASVFHFNRPIVLAGLFFAGDLFFWHLAILNTSVANATLLATLAPVWVVLGSSLFLRERPERQLLAGLALCLAGAVVLVGRSAAVTPGRLLGDVFGLATSVFFGAYFLAVRAAAKEAGPGRITFLSTMVTTAALFVVALSLEPQILPHSLPGIGALFGLAFISQAGGQGLLAFALGHLPAAFSSLVIFLEAIAAAGFGWVLLGEAVSWPQVAGGVLILAGIFIARPKAGGG